MLVHGKNRSYTIHKCRCTLCRQAHTVAMQKWRNANPGKAYLANMRGHRAKGKP